MNVERPTIAKPRDRFVYYPGGSPVPFSAAPKVYNRPFSITADVQIPDGRRRRCADRPRRPGRWLLLLRQGQPAALRLQLPRTRLLHGRPPTRTCRPVRCRSATNWSRPASPTSRPERACRPAASSTSTASWSVPSTCRTPCRTSSAPRASPAVTTAGSRVAPDDYDDAFAFTGTLKRVTIDLSGDLIPDTETDMKVAMARQ